MLEIFNLLLNFYANTMHHLARVHAMTLINDRSPDIVDITAFLCINITLANLSKLNNNYFWGGC